MSLVSYIGAHNLEYILHVYLPIAKIGVIRRTSNIARQMCAHKMRTFTRIAYAISFGVGGGWTLWNYALPGSVMLNAIARTELVRADAIDAT